MKILIDNGHGENTSGKRSPNGLLLEYAYTREIAENVVNGLLELGYDAERLVCEETDISLKERVNRINKFCNKLGAKNVIIISIHCNAASNGDWTKANGWSAYTTKGKTNSDKLATCLYNNAVNFFKGKKIRMDNTDGDPDWEENFYIIKHANCPAVLTENFFMDNKDDVDYLLSTEGKNAIIKTHINGIIDYLKTL